MCREESQLLFHFTKTMNNQWDLKKKKKRQKQCHVSPEVLQCRNDPHKIITTRDGKYFLGLAWSLNVSLSICLVEHLIQIAPFIIWLVETRHFSRLLSWHLLPEGLDDTAENPAASWKLFYRRALMLPGLNPDSNVGKFLSIQCSVSQYIKKHLG